VRSNETLYPSHLISVIAHMLSREVGMEHIDAGLSYEPPSIKTILLVEDDIVTALQLGEMLAQKAGYQVIFASDCLSALKFIRSYKADLILLNERLLTRNGIDLGPRLAVQDLQAIPLLLLSVDFT
jgi:CheY-like chemotaxis protein